MKEEQIYYHKDFEKKFLSDERIGYYARHLLKMPYAILLAGRLANPLSFA